MYNHDKRCANKTKKAIFAALEQLLTHENYYKISVGDIIKAANVGRSTFYNHFETRDSMFEEYLGLIFDELMRPGSFSAENHTGIPVAELLDHIAANRKTIKRLVSGDSAGIVFRKFKSYWNRPVEDFINAIIPPGTKTKVPRDLLTNYVTYSLIDMVKWWIENNMIYSSNQMEEYWLALVKPALASQHMPE
jgi:hypothetical protein